MWAKRSYGCIPFRKKKIPNVDIGQKHIFPKIDFENFVKRIGVGGGLGLILVTDPRLK